MATTEEEKKLQQPAAPTIYGGSYDQQLHDTYNNIVNRPKFTYDVNGDALYKQYKDQYTRAAQKSMQDTMGQAASLTGGYGSSYGQRVGQQAYDDQMSRLNDMIPTLQQNAYGMWKDQGDQLAQQYGMLSDMAGQEANTKQANYSNLLQLITTTGYQPSEEELKAAGISADQANSYRQYWITTNPLMAYNNGAIDADGYMRLTGSYPPGYDAGGGDGGWYGGGGNDTPSGNPVLDWQKDYNAWAESAGASSAKIKETGKYDAATQQAEKNYALYKHYGGK